MSAMVLGLAMTVEECTSFLDGRINYERRGMPTAKELRLDRMRLLLERLGNPHRHYRVVHIAGTKGKGSTAHTVAAMMQSKGVVVGLHTSPHFFRLGERFRVNGVDATEQEVADLAGIVAPHVAAVDGELAHDQDQPGLTYFEVTTAMAFLHFSRRNAAWAVVEVGMGGRLDSTNVVDPAVCVITTIGRDHTKQLGDDLEMIAVEKAGIIKPGVPVVSGVTEAKPAGKIGEIARQNRSSLKRLGIDFGVSGVRVREDGTGFLVKTWSRTWPVIETPLVGTHQAANGALAAATLDILGEGGLPFSPREAAAAVKNIVLPGRVEILSGNPTVVLDAAHNEPSAISLAATIEQLFPREFRSSSPRVLIFAVARDKHWPEMLDILTPHFDVLVATTFQSNPRALPVTDLRDGAWKPPTHLEIHAEPWAPRAFDWAIDWLRLRSTEGAGKGLICVAGSIFLAAELHDRARQVLQR